MRFRFKADELPNMQQLDGWFSLLTDLHNLIKPFDVGLKKVDRKQYRVFGTDRKGFIENVIRVGGLHEDKLPRDLSMIQVDETKAFIKKYADFTTLLQQIEEEVDDLHYAMRNVLMSNIDDVYSALLSAHKRHPKMDNVMEELSDYYKQKKRKTTENQDANNEVPKPPSTTLPPATNTPSGGDATQTNSTSSNNQGLDTNAM